MELAKIAKGDPLNVAACGVEGKEQGSCFVQKERGKRRVAEIDELQSHALSTMKESMAREESNQVRKLPVTLTFCLYQNWTFLLVIILSQCFVFFVYCSFLGRSHNLTLSNTLYRH